MRQIAAGAALTVALGGIVGGVVIAQQPRERVELIQPASGVQTPVPVGTSEPATSPTGVPTTSSVQAETTALPRVNLDAPVVKPAPVHEGVSPKPAPEEATAPKQQTRRQVQSEPAPVSTEPPAPASEAPSDPVAPSDAPPTTTNVGTSSPLPTVPGLSRPPLIPEP